MDSSGYGLIAAAIPALIQSGVGAAQMSKARKLSRGLEDPMYETPESALEALQNARVMASQYNMPGYENMVENMSQILSGAVGNINRAATSSPEALGAILNAVGMQTKASNDIGRMNAEVYMNNQEQLRNELRNIASYEDKKWGTNVLNPFLRQAAAAQALAGSGMQNVYSGLNNMSGIGAYGIKSGAFKGGSDREGGKGSQGFTQEEVESGVDSMPSGGEMKYDPVAGQWYYPGVNQQSWGSGSSAPLIPAIYTEA